MPSKRFSQFLLFLFYTTLSTSVSAQGTVTGWIRDSNQQPLAFATVYVQGTSNGTTSNIQGKYILKVPEGTVSIVAQHIGYKREIKEIRLIDQQTVELEFELMEESLLLEEVVVNANEVDPARAIIRNAIKKRKYYQKEVLSYATEVYMKGLQRLDKKPKSLLGMTVPVDTGIVYLSESVSKLKFLQPDLYNETLISSKVSGNNNGFSFNQASDMMVNLYENSFYIEGLSERPFISPIARSAFFYYDYQLSGTFIEDGHYVNKIKLLPKRRTDPVFSGYIYVIDSTWRLHSVDVLVTKANGIEFIDSLTFHQVFAPVDHDIWMPFSQRSTFQFKAFGFEGSGDFLAIYRNYQVQPAYEKQIFESPPAGENKVPKSRKDFSKAVVTVTEDANRRDSIYWARVRPIPLTAIEVRDYIQKDSLSLIKESKPYKDSINNARNQFKIGNLFFTGYRHYTGLQENYWSLPTFVEGLQYNAVEGVATNLDFMYTNRSENKLNYQLSPAFRYGFANRQLQVKLDGLKMVDQKTREVWTAGGGRYISQFNSADPITPYSNTLFTLMRGNNYIRLYQKEYGYIGYQKELTQGIFFTSDINYEDRQTLRNHASYNFANREFVPNSPINEEIDDTQFPRHQALTVDLGFNIRFAQKYIDRPDRIILLESKYPELNVQFRKGLPLFGGDVDYDLLIIGSKYEHRLGSFGTSQITGQVGRFLSSGQLYFPDFVHFNGNRTYFRKLQGDNLFQVLDYYRFSTRDRFVQLHYEHHFNEFILNKVPWFKRLNLQSIASINYLSTPITGNYFEFGVGIEHILKIIRVDFFSSFQNSEYIRAGIQMGIGF